MSQSCTVFEIPQLVYEIGAYVSSLVTSLAWAVLPVVPDQYESKNSSSRMTSDCYLRQRRRYMFLPVFVCLSVCPSVCLLARLLKNACMDLDEMLRVDRRRDMDELINFWLLSPIRIVVRMPEPDCFLRYRIGYGTLQPCLGCQRAALLRGILRRKNPTYTPLERDVVLKWFYSLSRRNTFVGDKCALPSALLVVIKFVRDLCCIFVFELLTMKTFTVPGMIGKGYRRSSTISIHRLDFLFVYHGNYVPTVSKI